MVAADATGDFVVVWDSADQDGSIQEGVFGQRFDSLGSPLGSQFQVNTHTTSAQYSAAVAKGGAGEFVVVWVSNLQDGASLGIFGQRFSSTGSPLGGEFQVNTYSTSYQYGPAVAASDGGDFIVVWTSHDEDAPGSGVFGRAFDSAGVPDGDSFQINTYTFSFQS